ncbi:divalent-cation tolerance protein CutA [Glycomyces sp. NPDC048151]|uniref:divalent-cation tolerance protein CutA n=1 Tax=Glycomyces sp. NPDC048151 TaxID=3364002 RepID=UPI003713AB5F
MRSVDAICEVSITGPDAGWLREFTRRLVEERLVACGQHIEAIRSVYRWEGRVHDEPEARVMLHTRQSLVPEIIRVVRAEHPYDVPCVLATLIDHANPDYRAWVVESTKAPGEEA